MKRILISLLTAVSLLLLPFKGECCTSAIFSGKVTASGRPIIWKNRDSSSDHNRVVYVPADGDIKYSFIYLSNSGESPEAWSGVNSAGFSIMNTVSYNIRREGDCTPTSMMDKEGFVMYRALATCSTLQDFENLLCSLEAPFGLETNFGVIDAAGGAAYYEVNNYTWLKYDVNEAPEGYIIRTNYSFSGRENQGKGYVRYNNASQLISRRIEEGLKIDARFIMDGLSRSYWQSEFGVNPLDSGKGIFVDRDFIPRRSTVAVTIAEGVNPGEDPSESVFWCAIGYPPAAKTVPMKVASGDMIPEEMQGRSSNYIQSGSFFLDFGDGHNYIDLDKVRSAIEKTRQSEEKIFDNFAPQFNREQLKAFYEAVEIR